MTPAKREYGELQLAILEVLWKRGEAAVADIRSALAPDREPAVSTVSTVLSRLEDQGAVEHRREGRRYVYRARVDRDGVRTSMVEALLDRAFDGDPAKLLSHLVRKREIEDVDLDRLQALVDDSRG